MRLVSDILQYNLRQGLQLDVNEIIMNEKHQKQPFYGFRKGQNISRQSRLDLPSCSCLDLSIRDAVLLLSNYSNIWTTFTSVFPKVS